MLKVNDLLTIRLYPYGEEKPSLNYTEVLFYICSHSDLDNNQFYTLIELQDGVSPWGRFESIEELENKINTLLEVTKVRSMKNLLDTLC